jgi:hypothetical protein
MDEKSLQTFEKELDAVLEKGKKITGTRMNIWTLAWLCGDVLEETNDISDLKRGQPGWPAGAVAVLGGEYGDDAFMYIDNNLEDGEVVVDFVEK